MAPSIATKPLEHLLKRLIIRIGLTMARSRQGKDDVSDLASIFDCLVRRNDGVKAEIDRRVEAYSRAAGIESAGKDDRGLDLIRYRKQFNGTTSYVAVAADWLARTGADDSVQGPYREARCGARSPRSNRPKRSAGTLHRGSRMKCNGCFSTAATAAWGRRTKPLAR